MLLDPVDRNDSTYLSTGGRSHCGFCKFGFQVWNVVLDSEFYLLPLWCDEVWFGREGWPVKLVPVFLAASAYGKDGRPRFQDVGLDVFMQFVNTQQDVICCVCVAVCRVKRIEFSAVLILSATCLTCFLGTRSYPQPVSASQYLTHDRGLLPCAAARGRGLLITVLRSLGTRMSV